MPQLRVFPAGPGLGEPRANASLWCAALWPAQVIVERSEASPGQADPLRDALTLFVDLAAVFVRVLVILLRNAEKRQQRNEREQRDRSKRRRY